MMDVRERRLPQEEARYTFESILFVEVCMFVLGLNEEEFGGRERGLYNYYTVPVTGVFQWL
jgi:hypothetical protein